MFKIKNMEKKMYNSKFKYLNFTESGTPEDLQEKTKVILAQASDCRKKSSSERRKQYGFGFMRKMDNELKLLSLLSSPSEIFNKNFFSWYKKVLSSDLLTDKLKNNFEELKNIIENDLNKKISKKNSTEFNNVFRLASRSVISYLNIHFKLNLNIVDAENSVKKNFTAEMITFLTISCVLSVRQVYDFSYTSDDAKIRNINLKRSFVKKSTFLFEFGEIFILVVAKILLKEDPKKDEKLRKIWFETDQILYSYEIPKNPGTLRLGKKLFYMFTQCCNLEFVKTSPTFKKFGMTLNQDLIKCSVPTNMLPSIAPILSTELNTIEGLIKCFKLVKQIKRGVTKVDFSDEVTKFANLSHSQKYTVSSDFIISMEKLDKKEYNLAKKINLPMFIPLSVIEFELSELKKLEKLVTEEEYKTVMKHYYSFLKSGNTRETFLNSLELFGISKESAYNVLKVRDLETKIDEMYQVRLSYNTTMTFLKMYNGCEIYYHETFDYRLRMYPSYFLFSRVNGIFKYSLEGPRTIITKDGIKTLFKIFFRDNPEIILSELDGYLTQLQNTKKYFLNKFFEIVKTKELNLEEVKEFTKNDFYRHLVKLTLFKLKSVNYTTGFMIQRDQAHSFLTLSSLIFRNSFLASKSNLFITKETEYESYLHSVMKHSVSFFNSLSNFNLSYNALSVLNKSRDLHKKSIMCYFYGETVFSRARKFYALFKNKQEAEFVAKHYNLFLSQPHVFGDFIKKKENFLSVVKNILKYSNNKGLKILTMDNSLICWNFYVIANEEKINIKTSNPFDKKKKITTRLNKPNFGTSDVKKLVRGVFANLIHSVDAFIVREVQLRYYAKTGRFLVHVHDCFVYNANDDKILKTILAEIYKSDPFKNFLKDNFFDLCLKHIEDPKKRAFCEDLVNKFLSNSRNEINITHIEEWHIDFLYPLV